MKLLKISKQKEGSLLPKSLVLLYIKAKGLKRLKNPVFGQAIAGYYIIVLFLHQILWTSIIMHMLQCLCRD